MPPLGLSVGERIGARKMERRLKWEVRFVVRVDVNCGVVREVIGREVMGATAQLMRMVGCVLNYHTSVSQLSCTTE